MPSSYEFVRCPLVLPVRRVELQSSVMFLVTRVESIVRTVGVSGWRPLTSSLNERISRITPRLARAPTGSHLCGSFDNPRDRRAIDALRSVNHRIGPQLAETDQLFHILGPGHEE
jgi:hypothetical protein